MNYFNEFVKLYLQRQLKFCNELKVNRNTILLSSDCFNDSQWANNTTLFSGNCIIQKIKDK